MPESTDVQTELVEMPIDYEARNLEWLDAVRAGNVAQQLLDDATTSVRKLSEKARIRAQRAVRQGRQGEASLLAGNMGLIHSVVNDVISASSAMQRCETDLIQDAQIGLLNAVREYDASEGVPFGTFAATHMRYAVRAGRETVAHTVKIPTGAGRVYRVALGARSVLTRELQREPTLVELKIAVEDYCTAWAYERLKEEHQEDPEKGARAILTKAGISAGLKNFERLMATGGNVTSLDVPVGTDSNSETIGALIGCEEDYQPVFDEADTDRYHNLLRCVFGGFNEKDRQIAMLRLGLGPTGKKETLNSIRERFGVTMTHINKIEQQITQRLMSPTAQYIYLYSGVESQIEVACETEDVQSPDAGALTVVSFNAAMALR